ncbi:Tyrosine-protein kinase [Trema orientale]|uniref:Tyrosine-protein kinase n=1 Tax=Trema orientale TaxID=63057 RepID=A0A2P5BYV8_TREOI|nr:Tyrosine-protein kinase [Trema orientale]
MDGLIIHILQVNNLTSVHHRNLVSLIGYCNDGDNLAVIYEYMAKGNLKQHISSDAVEVLNSWEKRLQIAVEVALGDDNDSNVIRVRD